ncbi:MAG: B12-binding domain-containing radical SAM protein [Armatimonadetes bacterium]|nr:B12-binding domain-containing radical SAM protein [Armatimonadota bacterium]
MKLLLIHPPQVGHLGLQDVALVEPLALERLAAAVPEAEVALLDMRLDADLDTVLADFRPDLVGLSCPFTTQVDITLSLAARVKAACPQAFVVVGGHHPSLRPGDFLDPHVDAIACGEGEHTFAELVACRREGGDVATVPGLLVNRDGAQQATPPRPPLADLDALPLPARHLTARWRSQYYWMNQRPHALVETSRGCPYRCNFCSVWRFHGTQVRYESPERVLEEVAAVPEPWVFFTDDNFLLSVPRAQRAAELIAEAGLRKQYTFQARTDTLVRHPELLEQWRDIGLVCVFLGLEKISDEALASVDKRNTAANNEAAIQLLKDLSIGFTGNFIVDPQWEPRDFAELRAYVQRHGLFNSSFSILTPLPGTVLFDEVEAQLATRDWERFDLWHSVLPTKLPPEQFYTEFASLWRAAAESAPRGRRLRRIIKGLMAMLRGEVDVAQMKRLRQGLRNLSDPQSYLQ